MSDPNASSRPRLWLMLVAIVAVILAVILYLSLRRQEAAGGAAHTGTPRPTTAPAAATAPNGNRSGDSIYRTALAAAATRRDPRQRSVEFATAFQHWLQTDEAGALAYLRSLPHDSPEFTQGLGFALRSMSETDPERALRLANELITTREQRMFYNSLFADWAKRSPAVAAKQVQLVPADAGRENAIRAVAENWAASDFNAALAWGQKLAGPDRAAAIESALDTLAATDPTRTVQLARESLEGAALARTLSAALQQLLQTDPVSAAAVVPLLPLGPNQNSAAATVARVLAARNPAEALQWAGGLPALMARTRATTVVFETWAANDAEGARHYVENMPVGAAQQGAAVAVAGASGAVNPEAAISWAQSLTNPDTRAQSLMAVANTWAQHDPAAATRWVGAQAPDLLGELGAPALNAALSYWVLQDAGAAREYVGTLPADRQAAAAGFVAPLLAQRDPVGALSWAGALPDAAARDRALVAAFARWRENAPADAQAWLGTANLTPSVKASLQKAGR